MLELRDICFEVDGKHILNHINLTIEDHQLYVITGPNGGGKSTLAKIIMGIELPTSGQILFNDCVLYFRLITISSPKQAHNNFFVLVFFTV